jgi:Tc toxin complex TcA C-terminal TcB-binding domain/ABC toxin N-terminal region/Neuraminidase-like domain/PA14 domain/Salmonella virulence plasmid 28.1kDa A protein
MRAVIEPVALNETSYNVAVLHQALAALGSPVADEEVAKRDAGQDTLVKVRALQAKLEVRFDESTLVDVATATAISGALETAGLTSGDHPFTVTGTVRQRGGSVRKLQRLLAFDVDLRGVAAYRSVKDTSEIDERGGFEFLGQTTSDLRGRYRLSFYDWQYARAERKRADVVVYAVEERRDGQPMIGHSRIVRSEEYLDKGLARNVDVVVRQVDTRTEYELLMAALNAFLGESDTSLAEIAVSGEQLLFTASELDIDPRRIGVAAAAERLNADDGGSSRPLSHELLYGIGRQGVPLSWRVLHRKPEAELRAAIAASIAQSIIGGFGELEIAAFLQAMHAAAVQRALNTGETGAGALNALLACALPEPQQRAAFVSAFNRFEGVDATAFWSEHLPAQPEFQKNPKLVSSLLLTQQLSLLTGHHTALVSELQTTRQVTDARQLLALETKDWLEILAKIGIPDDVDGTGDQERAARYAERIQSLLDASFPTRRIALMVEKQQLPIADAAVKGVANFLAKNDQFDFKVSRVHDFGVQIDQAAGSGAAAVNGELLRMQRVFQVSPTPAIMRALMEHRLDSARAIAGIPRKSFVKTYAAALGGDHHALAVHARAEHLATRTEAAAMHMWEYSHAATPGHAMGGGGLAGAMTVLGNHVPNYAELFGSPDLCECEHCRSVHGAAAYFVDLLRFLWRGEPNSLGRTPLDQLARRRPDLLHLPLTCENTNTVIPYVDLANEVMEYYTVNDALTDFKGYDTGKATAEELRANPQHFDREAYRRLKDATYPFRLPYHQPLDVIRTYGGHLKESRYQALKAMHPEPDAATTQAMAAERLGMAQEEHLIIAGAAFDGTANATPLHQYYGFTAAAQLESLSSVPELLRRSCLSYVDLLELVKTRFVNPHQETLDFLQRLFSFASIDADDVYDRLQQIEAGTLDPAADAAITATLAAYNAAQATSITAAQFGQWVADHLAEFRQVITLYEPESKCSLETTRLRTIESIYESAQTSGVPNQSWSRLHRFVRLRNTLGWTVHETDLMLAALGDGDITSDTIAKLALVLELKDATGLALNQLAVLWGDIDTDGERSLYRKLFLNKATHPTDAFQADAWGRYLQDPLQLLADHRSTILAAFRIREEDLNAILQVAEVLDAGKPRAINVATDSLNLANLSSIYRHVGLAKALKMRVSDVCKLIALFDAEPFSTWDIQQQRFVGGSPADTYEFFKLATATKDARFKPALLEYIFNGTQPADSRIGLDRTKALNTAKAIRNAFRAIEQDHPDTLPSPLTAQALVAKLSLTFRPEVAERLIAIVVGDAALEAIADANLPVVIPQSLADKYGYTKGSGRLTCMGVASDLERAILQGLPGATISFQAAVDELYIAPQDFISDNFGGVFTNHADAFAILLDHPAQPEAVDLAGKLAYIYARFIPMLKAKLRRDAIAQHLAALIGLSEAATALLVGVDVDALVADLSTEGFSATYFSDVSFTTPALEKADGTIDFDWNMGSPAPVVPADNFSARWSAYIAPPASGAYTLVAQVAAPDDAFALYLDETLVLQKPAAHATTSWEVLTELNAAQMHRLRLEYAETELDAGVRLQWKTATSAQEVIPAASAYPAAIVDRFLSRAAVWHRAGRFISGFELSEAELDHVVRFSADFANLDLNALTPTGWRRMYDYTSLRNAVPQAQASLVSVFAAANMVSPAATVPSLKDTLRLATAWDAASLDFLVDVRFALAVDDFKNEVALNRIREVMRIVAKTGMSAETTARWGSAETAFDALDATARLMKDAVKAKYGEEDWLTLAGRLNDTLRGHQRDALIAHLLTRPAIASWGARDADGLFEYFLIDVQMGACMDTSRIVQANAAVQMFVNRSLLNLESDMSGGTEAGVSPGAIDKDRWEWMKNYRVWEANRKVFLYPENWLEPEWRNDRSEFFRDLESFLVQNDITDRSVEQAFRNYLTSLDEVANLAVCAVCRENHTDGSLKSLHVFGRTHNAPYRIFCRRWNAYRKWSAWEKVGVDVRCVENGDDSGVHMVPMVWKNRLFLFWPEFLEKQEQPEGHSSSTMEDLSGQPVSTLEPIRHWEVRLAWSERVEGAWTPKQVSKEFVKQEHPSYLPNESALRFATETDADDRLYIYLAIETTQPREWYLDGRFELSDITSPVVADSGGFGWAHEQWDQAYSTHFMNVAAYAKLRLLGDTYLRTDTQHRLLLSPDSANFDPAFRDPFFFSALRRTYFVRPVTIAVTDVIRSPESYLPYLPGLVDDAKFRVPFTVPPPGPDDYFQAGGFSLDSEPLPAEVITLGHRAPVTWDFGVGSTRSPIQARTSPDMTYTEAAFGGVGSWTASGPLTSGRMYYGTGVEFHTFHHPFSGRYVQDLNRAGLPGLMQDDTALPSDQGDTFVDAYDPVFTKGLVQKPADFADRTYFKENVCFDVYGANSLYNWELFFHAPLYIATRLSRNGKFEQAMRWFHYIFDPTTDELPGAGESEVSRYWKVLPFRTTAAQSLEDWFRDNLSANTNPDAENAIIAEWRDNPFEPHVIAANRPLAYMKHVVVKYVENLMAWADSLFRQDTMESVNEALQLYVIANHILGPRPQFVPARGEIKAESYHSLETRWDDFSNALVALENVFPYSSQAASGGSSSGTSLLGVGPALYFCIPPNSRLLEYWDTVADRLFKIRHCQNIDGVERKLALFAPPIDPAALIQATSQGLSLGSILADLSSPPPIHRFSFLIQKANEFCADVKALGAALLAALEKKDADELERLRASHETQMLESMTAVKERQALDARSARENLLKARESASFRLRHYTDLLGNETVTVPAAPTLAATLTADSALPADTALATIATDVDASLVASDEGGVKIIPREKADIEKNSLANVFQQAGSSMEGLAGTMNFIPNFSANGEPMGVGATVSYGGSNIAGGLSGMAKVPQIFASILSHEAALASKMAGYIRREQEWTLQANLAAKEIVQLDKQITSADIRIQITEKELANHREQIENAKAIEQFLHGKFTSQELYQWMKEQLCAVYKSSYNLAYDMAKKAEKACRYDLGTEMASFVQYGYWDNARQGLAAGEKLQLALRQLERFYLEEHRRELELTRSVSLARLDPLALIQLRETGRCHVSLPEELFDLDFRGHYFRRIKSVRLSIPCVTGPHTSIACSLRLLNNSVRINTALNSAGEYEHEHDEGEWIDDGRFRTSYVPVKAIATSTAQDDPGLFDFTFRDDRYLPFEGAGVISEWEIELATDEELRQFDYASISDVILRLSYTAREDGGPFKEKAATYLKNFIRNAAELARQPLMQLFSMKHEFPTEWYTFLRPAPVGAEQILKVTLGSDRFPFLAKERVIVVRKIDLFTCSSQQTDYHATLSYIDGDGDPVTSTPALILSPNDAYGGLHTVTIDATDSGLDLEDIDTSAPISLKIKRVAAPDYTSLATGPDELNDVLIVLHYSLDQG